MLDYIQIVKVLCFGQASLPAKNTLLEESSMSNTFILSYRFAFILLNNM